MSFNDNFRYIGRDLTWRERIADNRTIGDYVTDVKDLLTLKSGRFVRNNLGKLAISGTATLVTAAVRGVNEVGIDKLFNDPVYKPLPNTFNHAGYAERAQYVSDNFFVNLVSETTAELLVHPTFYASVAAGTFIACAAARAFANIQVRK